MQDRPTAEELLATITDYLIGEVQPNVEGTLRYHTLVAANLCRMLERETRLYPAAAANERSALRHLLEVQDQTETPDQLGQLTAQLAHRLRSGDCDRAFEAAAWQVLNDTVVAKLAINKPGYDRYDSASEVTEP